VRIAFVRCSQAEIEAASRRLGSDYGVVEGGRVSAADFDLAIIGAAALVDGALPVELERLIEPPAIVLLRDRESYASCTAEVPVVALPDADRLPIAARRLLRYRDLVAARMRVEERLAAREAQLAFAHELARIGSWEWNPQTDSLTLSPEMIRTFGLESPVGSMREWLSIVEPDDRGAVQAALSEVATSGEPVEARFRIRRGDGEVVYAQARAQRVGIDRGMPLRVVGVTQDVTAEMLSQQTLRESEARYRTLVEQAKDIIVAFDDNGMVQSLNRAFEELTGWSRIEWIGRPFIEALDADSRPDAAARFEAALKGEALPPASEYRLRRRDGSLLTVEGAGRAVEAAGRAVGVVVVARDITARKEADARLEKEKRLASLGQLATSVAHEFNNVLMSIMPFAELLQRSFRGDDRVATATQHILRATRRGREISQEILRFARPAAPVLETLVAADWLEEFRRRAAAIFGPAYHVTAEMPPTEIAFVADRLLLEQVATNVALNARDAMPSGGSFRISVREEGNRVHIEFTDSGCGIDPALLDRIFEPLFTTKRGGNGLGLSVAHLAMVQQDGTISVRSKPGEGSTFTISLRRAEAPARSEQLPAVRRTRRVLVVEDDPSVGAGIRALLDDEGFEVRVIERGEETLAAVEAFDPMLVLLDVNLPDVGGVEVYDQLRSRWPSLPVIFSTGHGDARAVNDLRERRVPSIMKPYDAAELLAVIDSVTAAGVSPGE
jgi:PAS domain S-box-containing protein